MLTPNWYYACVKNCESDVGGGIVLVAGHCAWVRRGDGIIKVDYWAIGTAKKRAEDLAVEAGHKDIAELIVEGRQFAEKRKGFRRECLPSTAMCTQRWLRHRR